MKNPEIRSERLSFTLQPTLKKLVDTTARPQGVSLYVGSLIIKDLRDRGILSAEELERILYGGDTR